MKPVLLHISGESLRGGTELSCAVFLRHAPAFSHVVVVLGRPGVMDEVWRADGAEVISLDCLESGWFGFCARLRKALEGRRFAAAILWAGIRVPLVASVLASHDCPVALHVGNPLKPGGRIRAWLWLACRLLPRPKQLVAISCSQHVKRSLAHLPYYRNIAGPVRLNPVEAPESNPHVARQLRTSQPLRLGMVARLDPIKNHDALIRAFARLRSKWPCAELHLAGDGPLRASLERLAFTLGVADAVAFHGSISTVPQFLSGLDLYCFITTEQEGLGNALVEAMAAGLPCVVSELPVMREIAGDPEFSVAFSDPGEQALAGTMDHLLGDRALRAELSEKAWLRARSGFNPKGVVEVYTKAMGLC